jgi:glucose/arabinose dehydrogenase
MTRGVEVCLGAAVAAALSACGGSGSSSPTPLPSATPPGGSCAAGSPVSGIPALAARLVVSGLRNPLDLQAAPGDRERLYVVEQAGRIQVVRNGQLQAAPFLDIASRISSGGERGLLGLAFHPQFATNRRFFVNYTDPRGDTHVAEFRAGSADAADAGSERLLFVVTQPFSNHNGGGLAFDVSGRLLVALGDGGSAGDPFGNGQRLDTFLGKILRIDVDAATPYAVPPDNPFRATSGAAPEIWAYGLRNPFRIFVDRPTGDLYIGDVGQGRIEEVDVGLASRRGGENYGWNVTEGSQCFNPADGCARAGFTLPVYEYTHAEGCSITGGAVYRGCRMPDLAGTYFFADFCSGLVRSFRLAGGQATDVRDWTAGLRGIDSPTSFGKDADGEVYVVDYDGEVYRLEPAG